MDFYRETKLNGRGSGAFDIDSFLIHIHLHDAYYRNSKVVNSEALDSYLYPLSVVILHACSSLKAEFCFTVASQ